MILSICSDSQITPISILFILSMLTMMGHATVPYMSTITLTILEEQNQRQFVTNSQLVVLQMPTTYIAFPALMEKLKHRSNLEEHRQID